MNNRLGKLIFLSTGFHIRTKKVVFKRTGMRKLSDGTAFPQTFCHLILMIWRACISSGELTIESPYRSDLIIINKLKQYVYYYKLLFFQPYSRTAVWRPGVRPPSGVAGHRVPWPAAKEFQWEPGLFSCRKKRQCWDVTGKWSKRKCARPPSASAKVCTSFRGCVYCHLRAAGMYWDVGTCPSPFICQISWV